MDTTSRFTESATSVVGALETRFSCRSFLNTPLEKDQIRTLILRASRAPSGGNLQPWHVFVLTGAAMTRLITDISEKAVDMPMGEGSDYHIYPPNLGEPYRRRRYDIGAQMYQLLGISQNDKAARLAQLAENFNFFGAPCALFFTIDREMQQGQWADIGMFMQSLMLLARAEGLHTCPQESWAIWSQTVRAHLGIPDHMLFFCAMAIGYSDSTAVVNQLVSPRADLEEFVKFVGFE